MFDIGLGELILIFVIGLIVLGPERFLVAIRMVTEWIRVIRSIAAIVQNELMQEFKLQDRLKTMDKVNIHHPSPDIKVPNEFCEVDEDIKQDSNIKINNDVQCTIHNPLVTKPEVQHEVMTFDRGNRQAEIMVLTQAGSSRQECSQQLALFTSSTNVNNDR